MYMVFYPYYARTSAMTVVSYTFYFHSFQVSTTSFYSRGLPCGINSFFLPPSLLWLLRRTIVFLAASYLGHHHNSIQYSEPTPPAQLTFRPRRGFQCRMCSFRRSASAFGQESSFTVQVRCRRFIFGHEEGTGCVVKMFFGLSCNLKDALHRSSYGKMSA